MRPYQIGAKAFREPEIGDAWLVGLVNQHVGRF